MRAWRGARPAEAWLLGTLVALAAAVPFLPALDNGLVSSWDDGIYIRDNPLIRSLSWPALRAMAVSGTGGLWQPLTWASLAFDYRLWNLDPWGYHLTNIALHAAASLLFYALCRELFKSSGALRSGDGDAAAAFAALFFAVHPLRVESVVWATERKDVLSGALFAACVLLRLRGLGWAALAAFALALASKASTAALPALLVVLAVYPLGRIPADARRWTERSFRPFWLELAPYAALSAAAVGLNLAAAHAVPGASAVMGRQSLAWRLGQVCYGALFYPSKTLWPGALAPLYPPRPWFGAWSPELLGCVGVAALASAAAVRLSRRRPWLGAALAGYAVLLAPVSGLVQHGQVPFSACDRFSYLACLPLAALFGAAAASAGAFGRAAAAAWLIALGALSWRQSAVWRDSVALWSCAEERAPGAVSSVSLGQALTDAGRAQEALPRLKRAVAAYPDFWLGYDALGMALRKLGREDEARAAWRAGLAVEPACQLNAHLGASLASQGGAGLVEALPRLQAAVSQCPSEALLRVDYADALSAAGRPEQAAQEYAAALALEPGSGPAHCGLGQALFQLGRADEAVAHFRRALYARQGRAETLYDWGNLLLASGRAADAERRYREALRLEPALARAQVNLGNILARRGDLAGAQRRYRAALKEDPGLSEAKVNLAAVRRALGRY